jgi:hypothetical protein
MVVKALYALVTQHQSSAVIETASSSTPIQAEWSNFSDIAMKTIEEIIT